MRTFTAELPVMMETISRGDTLLSVDLTLSAERVLVEGVFLEPDSIGGRCRLLRGANSSVYSFNTWYQYIFIAGVQSSLLSMKYGVSNSVCRFSVWNCVLSSFCS